MIDVREQELEKFAQDHQINGISEHSLRAIFDHKTGYSVKIARRFLEFQSRIDRELLQHRIITNNRYTAWFRQGLQTREQLRAFIVQFSVFSNQFLVAQLQKMINADTLEGMRASKEILANEIGVLFSGPRAQGLQVRRIKTSREIPSWWRRRVLSTVVHSGSAPHTLNG